MAVLIILLTLVLSLVMSFCIVAFFKAIINYSNMDKKESLDYIPEDHNESNR